MGCNGKSKIPVLFCTDFHSVGGVKINYSKIISGPAVLFTSFLNYFVVLYSY